MAPIHPLIVAMAVIGLGGVVFGVYERAPWLIPWILLLSAAGMVIRALMVRGEERAYRGDGNVDHDALRAMDFARYGDWLKENVRGHDRVVDVVVQTIQRGLKLTQTGRSPASFLLVGPTGTGKTFLALMTAKALWPEKEPVVLRMNQLKSPGDVSLLLGTSGHSGPESEGTLTRAIAEDPHRVILLDEIDKCHPEVLHALFDALDGGKGRDKSSGRTVDFSGCVFFATCNAGVESLRALAGSDAQAYVAKARDALARDAGFDKSFLARFSEILLMDELPPRHIAEIACLLIGKQWREQGVEVRYITPEFLASAVKANEEFHSYGVRQLAHCVRRMTDGLLDDARRRGLTSAALGVDAAGTVRLEDKAARAAADR
jgi:ATP-dependent Clp protease ATP-binding subunit ClpA